MLTTTKHQIRVDGKVVNAFYASKEQAMGRVKIAKDSGHAAEYAGTVHINPLAHCGIK